MIDVNGQLNSNSEFEVIPLSNYLMLNIASFLEIQELYKKLNVSKWWRATFTAINSYELLDLTAKNNWANYLSKLNQREKLEKILQSFIRIKTLNLSKFSKIILDYIKLFCFVESFSCTQCIGEESINEILLSLLNLKHLYLEFEAPGDYITYESQKARPLFPQFNQLKSCELHNCNSSILFSGDGPMLSCLKKLKVVFGKFFKYELTSYEDKSSLFLRLNALEDVSLVAESRGNSDEVKVLCNVFLSQCPSIAIIKYLVMDEIDDEIAAKLNWCTSLKCLKCESFFLESRNERKTMKAFCNLESICVSGIWRSCVSQLRILNESQRLKEIFLGLITSDSICKLVTIRCALPNFPFFRREGPKGLSLRFKKTVFSSINLQAYLDAQTFYNKEMTPISFPMMSQQNIRAQRLLLETYWKSMPSELRWVYQEKIFLLYSSLI